MDMEYMNAPADCPQQSPVVTATTVGATRSACCNCWLKNVCPFNNCS